MVVVNIVFFYRLKLLLVYGYILSHNFEIRISFHSTACLHITKVILFHSSRTVPVKSITVEFIIQNAI